MLGSGDRGGDGLAGHGGADPRFVEYHITQVDKHVFIVTYGCHADSDAPVVVSSEHKEAGLFTKDEVPGLTMPEGYKRSVLSWFAQPDT